MRLMVANCDRRVGGRAKSIRGLTPPRDFLDPKKYDSGHAVPKR